MATITSKYLGDLRVQSTHTQSGTELVTDAPVDNHGKGESFSPTDLVAVALGNCILTIMGIAAQNHGIDLTGARVTVDKKMVSSPRRIGELSVKVYIPSEPNDEQKKILENAAHSCPVGNSIKEGVEIVEFFYGQA